MKKTLTLLMLALSLATFAQNATKVVVLDTYNRGGKLKQSTLVELKTNLAQIISETYGFEGVIVKEVDFWLLAEGFAEHPRLSEEQAKQVANLSGTPYAIMSEASIDDFGYISLKTILINLDAYQVMASESTSMNNTADQIHKGCEKLAKKIIEYLPKPEMPILEENPETVEQLAPTEPLPAPQQLTSLEAEKVSRLLNHADVCIEMNYIDEAIKKYDEIVSIAPGWANVYMYLGNTYASKGDAASLKKAKENYQKFMHLTDDQDLYYEAQDKLSRIEMMVELITKETEKNENLLGIWKSNWYDKHSGKPWFIIEILPNPNQDNYQIKLSPKSFIYNDVVSKTTYTELVNGEMAWSLTRQQVYIPSQSKYNAQHAMVNILAGDNNVAAAIGGYLVEAGRESDVGYTNIFEYNFLTNTDIEKKHYNILDDGKEHVFINGSVQAKYEHHQNGVNRVVSDTVCDLGFYKDETNYPVLLKIDKQGNTYKYGDYVIKRNKTEDIARILRMGGYVDDELNNMKKTNFGESLGLGLIIAGAPIALVGIGIGVAGMGKDNGLLLNGLKIGVGGLGMILLGGCTWMLGDAHRKTTYRKLIDKHNQKVDETRMKFRQNDQARVSFNVGLSSTGVGVYLNF